MAGIKRVELMEFHRLLRVRGLTVTALAERMMCGRTHLTQVLNGTRRGSQTWRKLEKVLTADELALLSHVRQCPVWNSEKVG